MKNLVMFAGACLLLASCSSDNADDLPDIPDVPAVSDLTLNLDGLEDLGSDFLYEGWIIVDGAPISTGTFSVSDTGELSQSSFSMDAATLDSATNFVLTIEPVPDPAPGPADTKLLIGDFSGNSATVSTGTVAESFANIAGEYILATPTGTGAAEEEFSGIWFLDNSSGSPMVGLELPTLSDGWKYEGWAVIDGAAVTTGTFTSVTGEDDAATFSGANPSPPFPGEDFLVNAPDGLTFPTDLRNGVAVISIEPYPDNSPAPFTLKPLVGMVPADAMGVQAMNDNVSGSFPSGSVSR
ncbi:MAG: hypothetical protein COA50_05925 [Flavobacteriaceae bacterium]|nr:MAG: hypothetical protein COA50_05925 [Flavobacteriaceae bacterium]